MDLPVVFDKKPVALTLKPGTYYWCSCGLSANQPFCNGAHQGSSFTPQAFEVTEEKTLYLCNCKKTEKNTFLRWKSCQTLDVFRLKKL